MTLTYREKGELRDMEELTVAQKAGEGSSKSMVGRGVIVSSKHNSQNGCVCGQNA